MRYFASDVDSIHVPQTTHVHRREPADAERLVIDCAACDPYLARYGGALTLADAPLSYDERKDIAEQRRKAEMVLPRLADAIVQTAADQVRGLPA